MHQMSWMRSNRISSVECESLSLDLKVPTMNLQFVLILATLWTREVGFALWIPS